MTASGHRLYRAMIVAVLSLTVLAMTSGTARAQALVADLSDHLIAITTGFTGADVVLFGAVEDAGDVVVVVRGPDQDAILREKVRRAGIWISAEVARFDNVPSFYHVASSRPLEDVTTPSVRARHEIGLDALSLEPAAPDDMTEEALADYQKGVISQKQEEGNYSLLPGTVSFIGGGLFRTRLTFPENVPTGRYHVSVYFLQEGEVVGAQTTPLMVNKVGVGAEIFLFAHDNPPVYGLLAIIVAIMAGWLSSLPFRKA